MALPNALIGEVRASGHTDNSGLFNPARGGTDRTQQNAAHVIFDGATITATTTGASAIITISGYTVSSADLGNVVRITGGTNFITSNGGLYEITAVDTTNNRWTLDRNCTTGAGSGMTGRMGGASASPGRICTRMTEFGKLWIKADGVQSITNATIDAALSELRSMATAGRLEIEGYDQVRGDRTGTRPILRVGANSRTLINYSASGNLLILRNLELDGNRASFTGGVGIQTGSDNAILIEECHFTGFGSFAINGGVGHPVHVRNSTFTNNSACIGAPNVNLNECEFYANPGSQMLQVTGGTIERCLFYENTCSSAVITGSAGIARTALTVRNCAFEDNDAPCILVSQTTEHLIIAEDCVAIGTTGYAFDGGAAAVTASAGLLILRNCAGYNNSSGNVRNAFENTGFLTLTADPFTNTAGNDYSLNDTAGGGADLQNAGLTPSWPRGLTPDGNPLDVGAWQTAESSGGEPVPTVGQIWPSGFR
jgi:hypothetical protein